MATKYLSANASLSAAVWWTTSGGSTTTTSPTTGDNADLNGHTLTVDQAFTCDSIVGSGTLAVSGDRTITANIGDGTNILNCTLSASQTVNFVGIFLGAANTILTISGASTVVNITGKISSNSGTNSGPIVSQSAGNLMLSGTLTAGSPYVVNGLNLSGGQTTISGTVIGAQGSGVSVGGGTLTMIGDINASSGITLNSGRVIMTGNATGAVQAALFVNGGNFSLTGNLTGVTTSSNVNGFGMWTTGGTTTINGTVTGGNAGFGFSDHLSGGQHGLAVTGGIVTLNGSMVQTGNSSPVLQTGGTFTFNPGLAIIGGSTLTAGSAGGVIRINTNGGFGG